MSEFAALLGPVAAAQVNVVDVESDPELKRKFGDRIPVVLFDDDFVCAYRLDLERVRRHL
jgi:hypothetical protein